MEALVTAIVGVICIVIGILHTKGNISLLHSYHTKRVSEEDKLPFSKKIGLGTIIIGVSLVLAGGFAFLSTKLDINTLFIISNVILAVGFIVGFGIILYALIKYNKGIF